MSELIRVGMSEIACSRSPDVLVTYGLGSCVGVCIYDPLLKIGGMAHVMLPDSSLSKTVTNRGKFADTSIPDLTARLIQMGTLSSRLVAKIAGGSQMFAFMGNDDKLLIGPRNVAAVEKALKEQRIKLSAKNVGGSAGRSILFDLTSGEVTIKMLNSSDIIL